jgi:predicted nuclease of predicted toxin-antitoxin system
VSELFIRIFLDENMDVRIAKVLRARGFAALTTHEVGRRGASDADQLAYCAENGYAIVTMDRLDFELLAKEYFYAGQQHAGIILVSEDSPYEIARRLSHFLDLMTADEMENQVVYI